MSPLCKITGHKWEWFDVADHTEVRGTSVTTKTKKRYRCVCGALTFTPDRLRSPVPAGDSTQETNHE